MRVLVFSDCHGRTYNVRKVLDTQNANCIIFLGDGLREMQEIMLNYPKIKFYSVAGNCDRYPEMLEMDLINLGGKRILFTHGHSLGVNFGTERLWLKGKEAAADVVLYGHTHIAQKAYYKGMYLINPGSISCPRDAAPSYAVLEIQNGDILPYINRI